MADLVCLFKAIQQIASSEDVSLVVHAIPLSQVRWVMFSDAAFGNASKKGSQGAELIALTTPEFAAGGEAPVSVLAWRSAKVPRVTPSTLGAETQALSRGLGRAERMMVLFEDAARGPVDRSCWAKAIPPILTALKSNGEIRVKDPFLQAVVDAKSVFDTLERDCDSRKGEDRTAIELAVMRESMSRVGCSVRWIPHTVMPVDQMTKLSKTGQSNHALLGFLRDASFRLVEHSSELAKRASDPSHKLRTKSNCDRAMLERRNSELTASLHA